MRLFSAESFSFWRMAQKLSVVFCFFLLILVAVEFQTFVNASSPREIELVWKLSSEGDVAGYKIYYDTASRYQEGFNTYRYNKTLDEGEYTVENNTGRFLLASLDPHSAYWVSVTAFDHSGNESDFSNEMSIVPARDMSAGGSSGGCQSIRSPTAVSRKNLFVGSLSFLLPCFWILVMRRRVKSQA